MGLLEKLLIDKTTKRSIMWATDAYELRKEQQEAVSTTKAYFENGGEEFLKNSFGMQSHDSVRR